MTILNVNPSPAALGKITDIAKGISGSETALSYLKGLITNLQAKILAVADPQCIGYTGEYIAVGLGSSPAQVKIIDPVTLNVVGTWTGDAGYNDCRALVTSYSTPTNIYVALDTGPTGLAAVISIDITDPTTPVTASIWTGAAGQTNARSLVRGTGGYALFVGLNTTPAQVVKIGASFTTLGTWTGAGGQNEAIALTWDYVNTRLVVGLNTTPAQVVKVDPSGAVMATVLTWTGATGQDECQALAFDGLRYYAGLGTSPAQIIKINLTTMTTLLGYEAPTGMNNCLSLITDGLGSLYVGTFGLPQIGKLSTLSMTLVGEWTGDSNTQNIVGIVSDTKQIFVINNAGNQLIRLSIPAQSGSDSSSLISQINSDYTIETWQDAVESFLFFDTGIDRVRWTVTNPATSAWAALNYIRCQVGALLMGLEEAGLTMNSLWQNLGALANPLSSPIDSLVMEWEMGFQAPLGQFDNTECFYGLVEAKTDIRSSNGLIGFGLTGGANALQTVNDDAGAETTNTGFGETLTNWNKFKIVIKSGSISFYLNEILIAIHTTNLTETLLYPRFWSKADATGGGPYFRLGMVKIGYVMRS